MAPIAQRNTPSLAYGRILDSCSWHLLHGSNATATDCSANDARSQSPLVDVSPAFIIVFIHTGVSRICNVIGFSGKS